MVSLTAPAPRFRRGEPARRAAPDPPWAFDLLSAVVPRNRSCADARVPSVWCACANEPTAAYGPSLGVCHGDQNIHNMGRFCPRDGKPHHPMLGTSAASRDLVAAQAN